MPAPRKPRADGERTRDAIVREAVSLATLDGLEGLSIGNLAGFAAPYAMGYLKDATGGFTAGLLAVAFFPFLSAILVLILGHNPALERGAIPEGAH